MHAAPQTQALKRTLTILALAALMTVLSANVAFADTIAAAQARAAQVQSQVAALQTKAEIASEQYNAAQSRYTSLSAQVHTSEREIAKLDAAKHALQGTLDTHVVSMYRQGPLGFLEVVLNAHNLSDFDAAYQIMTNINRKDAQTVQQLKTAKEQAAAAKTLLVRQQTAADGQQQAMADNEHQVKSHLSASTQLLAQADSTVKSLIAQKQAADAAAARAEAQRVLAEAAAASAQQASSSDSGSGGSGSSSGGSSSGSSHASKSYSGSSGGGNPPTSSKGAAAVYWAEKKLGCPYVWAASGPNEFDCSGLTMWAWGKAGVSLPHYSGDQINRGQRVSKAHLQPGDLVFFGSPIHHVGMYVGGGDFIEAPYTGVSVRISKLSHRDDFAGACRP